MLVPVYRDGDGALRVVLVIRGPRGRHGDQVGLPGGRPEPEDDSLLATALREAEEEVGLTAADVLPELEPLETRATGYRVHPFLARVRPPVEWRLAPGEIGGVVTPRVRDLADAPRTHAEPPRAPGPVECIELDGGHTLWGMTLRLLDPLLLRLLAGDWQV